jgi:hypothetical protein
MAALQQLQGSKRRPKPVLLPDPNGSVGKAGQLALKGRDLLPCRLPDEARVSLERHQVGAENVPLGLAG